VTARGVAEPAARQQRRKVEIADPILHEQDEPRARLLAGIRRHADLGAEDRLDSSGARRAVELDRAEQVAEVGDRERALAVGGGGGDGVVDPERAVDDRILGVRAQVDEGHAVDSRERADARRRRRKC
jgi:hypothetical protein